MSDQSSLRSAAFKFVSEQFGPLLLLAMAIGAIFYGMFYFVDKMLDQQDRLINLVVQEILQEQKRVATVLEGATKEQAAMGKDIDEVKALLSGGRGP